MPFRRPNRKTWTVSIRTPAGEVRRSTGTSDRKTAVAIERLVNALQAKRDRALLNAVVEGGLTLGALYDAHVANALEALRQHLISPRPVGETDIEPFVDKWLSKVAREVRADTVQHYRLAARRFIPAGIPFPVSQFRKKRINE